MNERVLLKIVERLKDLTLDNATRTNITIESLTIKSSL